jgi:hypothetical protein
VPPRVPLPSSKLGPYRRRAGRTVVGSCTPLGQCRTSSREGADMGATALNIFAGPLSVGHRQLIVDRAVVLRLPTMHESAAAGRRHGPPNRPASNGRVRCPGGHKSEPAGRAEDDRHIWRPAPELLSPRSRAVVLSIPSVSWRACRRHVNTCCGVSPRRRAMFETTAPGANVSSTTCALKSSVNWRRRPVPVITSSR